MQKNERTVWIDEVQLGQILKEAFLHFPNETGGVLMGIQNGFHFLVSHIIGPGPKAIHNPRSFIPDSEFQEKEIANIYKEQQGVVTYLGDWHTHPNANSYLSEIDKTTLKRIAQYTPARLPEPLMLVLGTHPFKLKCWKYNKSLIAYNHYQEVLVGYQKRMTLEEINKVSFDLKRDKC